MINKMDLIIDNCNKIRELKEDNYILNNKIDANNKTISNLIDEIGVIYRELKFKLISESDKNKSLEKTSRDIKTIISDDLFKF